MSVAQRSGSADLQAQTPLHPYDSLASIARCASVLYMFGSVSAMRSTHIYYSGHNRNLLISKLSGNFFLLSRQRTSKELKRTEYTHQTPSFVDGGGQLSCSLLVTPERASVLPRSHWLDLCFSYLIKSQGSCNCATNRKLVSLQPALQPFGR